MKRKVGERRSNSMLYGDECSTQDVCLADQPFILTRLLTDRICEATTA